MGSASFTQIPAENESKEDTETGQLTHDATKEGEPERGFWVALSSPVRWFAMLAEEMHWTSVVGVVVVYGLSQGLGGALYRVSSDYYWKDVQMVQPSEAQIYQGIINLPWIVKPLWGLLTDVLPIAGYRRRPYFIFAGLLGVISALTLSLHKKLHVVLALLSMTAGSAGVAIADVTVDACVAQNSISCPSLAADMQSLCGFSSSIGGLLGFLISGLLIHLMGSQGVLGLLSVPAALVVVVGIMLKENHTPNFAYRQVYENLLEANKKMLKTLRCPDVWRPCLYMYLSLALSLNIQEGMFYWYTDSKAGPSFSQETVGFMFSVGSVGSLLGVLLYQNVLKDYPFRSLLFWTQLLFGFSGMLDLILVMRINLKYGMPDYFFAVIDECITQMIARIKWMPLLVLSSKLCPSGIEGTFFALLMSIDNVGLLTSTWGGGLLLHVLKITRTKFHNLWVAILMRTILRLFPLSLLCFVPKSDHRSINLPMDMLMTKEATVQLEEDNVELISLVGDTR